MYQSMDIHHLFCKRLTLAGNKFRYVIVMIPSIR